ncbi:hypothetical protein [Thermococcus sp. PK]|uniref:hypothetical protein n=1 Tax=Thermococcus sp. PK TaxID=913025 RepID=UPI0012EBB25F|nr:hypothetical protein [Thermococcus sp. PK]
MELQKSLVQLGRKLGFLAEKEFPLVNLFPGYSPIIDVVWFYPLSEQQSHAIKKLYGLWPYWKDSRALYPYATFEITASDATSKTVMSEIWNMKLAGFRYAFKIVPSKNPKHPDYMHKERAERINRTLNYFSGTTDVFVLSLEDVENAINTLTDIRINPRPKSPLSFKTPNLRDNLHNDITRKLAEFGKNKGFISAVEYMPRWIKKLKERLTPIRTDAVWLLDLPSEVETGFSEFLELLGGLQTIKSTNPVEVLAFEVELGVFDKHSIGSVLNLANIFGRGVVVVSHKDDKLVETIRLLSSNRVDVKGVNEMSLLF